MIRRRRRPHPRNTGPITRINGRIRAREVRVVHEGKQLGVLAIGEALKLAKGLGVDLVEISAKATPPVCRLVDYGKYQYEQEKEAKKNPKTSHAGKVKIVQLRPKTDVHDFNIKLERAVDFLCDEMKVKVSLRFRGRENRFKDVGAETVKRFVEEISKWGKTDAPPQSAGNTISVMIAPLPKSERAENPHAKHRSASDDNGESSDEIEGDGNNTPEAPGDGGED